MSTNIHMLGSANGHHFDSLLAEDIEDIAEEDYDTLNDETFGDGAVVDEDWEAQHELLTGQENNELSLYPHDIDDEAANEIDFEKSVSKLVVDDDLDDPAIMKKSTSRPIPNKKLPSHLIGHSLSPPIINTESLMTPGSPNIWGSPTLQETIDSSGVGLKTFSKLLNVSQDSSDQSAPWSSPFLKAHHQLLPNVIGNQMKMSSLPAPQSIHSSRPADVAPPTSGSIHPQTKQLLDMLQNSSDNRTGQPKSSETVKPPVHLMTLQELESKLMADSTPKTNAQQPQHRADASANPPNHLPSQIPQLPPQAQQNMASSFMYRARMAQMAQLPPALQSPDMMRNPLMLQHRQMMMHNMRNRAQPPPRHFNHNNMQRFRMGQPRDTTPRDRQNGLRHPGRPPPYHHPGDGGGDGHQMRDDSYREHTAVDPDADPYANLMTKAEKDWITRIQLMQLHTDNPYLDDFYFTTWSMQKDSKDNNNESMLVLPHYARPDTKSYRPVQFENSLGRLTTASVHNPRQIIDLHSASSTSEEDGKVRDIRKFKQQLVDIEQCYDLLLEIDDIEKQILALPVDGRAPLLEKRKNNIEELFNRFDCHTTKTTSERFLRLLMVRKGVKLIARSMTYFDSERLNFLALAILRNLPLLSKKDSLSDALPVLFKHLYSFFSASSSDVLLPVGLELDELCRNNKNCLEICLKTKFGASVLWSIFSCGCSALAKASPLDINPADKLLWDKFLIFIIHELATIPSNSLATPWTNFANLSKHVERTAPPKLFAQVEEKLALLSSA